MGVLVAHGGGSRRWIWRILKWTSISIIAVLAAGAAIGIGHRLAFERLSPRQRHFSVYNAFCAQIRQHYFDSSFSGVEWEHIDQQWRERAAGATSDSDLYMNVLENIGLQFPASHVGAQAPSQSPAEPVGAKTTRVVDLFMGGPGFENALLRRGTSLSSTVGDVVPGSAAEQAGIEPGWIVKNQTLNNNSNSPIVHFTGEFVRLTPVQQLQYERTLQITYRPGIGAEQQMEALAANTVKVEYDLIPLPTRPVFETKRLPGGSLYIRFDTFMDSKVVGQVLAELDQAGPEGTIIDLRENVGGTVEQLRRMLDRVLRNNSCIGAERSVSGITEWRTSKNARTYTSPLVVLIGPVTVSAAEIFAAAIQDNLRGRLLGRMTNGSVLKARRFPLPDGGVVEVPVSDFVRAIGTRIEGAGVEPDIRIVPSLAEIRAGHDPVIKRALLELRNGMNSQ